MSILLSDRIKVVLSVLVVAGAFLFVPANAGASTCGVMSNSFRCLSGAVKKKVVVRKRTKVSGLRKVGSRRNAVSLPKAKSRSKRRLAKKARSKRRSARKVRTARRSKKGIRKNKSLRKIGRRLNPRSVRKLTKRGSVKRGKASKTAKRGWRTRSKGLGYVAARGASTRCFPARLKALLKRVSVHYGRKLVITSGYRSQRHNRRIGGARRSQHLHCTAADFYIPGVNKFALARYLKGLPGRGGVGTYAGNRTVHLDIGPRRSWHWGGRKRHAKRGYTKKRRLSRVMRARRLARKRRVAKFRGSQS